MINQLKKVNDVPGTVITKEEFEKELNQVIEEQIDLFMYKIIMDEIWKHNYDLDEDWLNDDEQNPVSCGIDFDVYRYLSDESQKFYDDNNLYDYVEDKCRKYYESHKWKYLVLINYFYENVDE